MLLAGSDPRRVTGVVSTSRLSLGRLRRPSILTGPGCVFPDYTPAGTPIHLIVKPPVLMLFLKILSLPVPMHRTGSERQSRSSEVAGLHSLNATVFSHRFDLLKSRVNLISPIPV